jgi:hypothetical protein
MARSTRSIRPALLAAAIAFAPLFALGGPTLQAAIQGPDVKNPHGDLKEPCAFCHTANGWKEIRVNAKFDHAKYGFPLNGAHRTNCLSCHTTLRFESADVRCASCHQDPHLGEMGADCTRCHSARSFIDRAPMVRAHQLTRFPLIGAHAILECESCHASQAQGHLQFKGTRAACDACHMADYQATRNPDHQAGGFPLQCMQCHGTVTWNTDRFDHDRTGFPLTGAHRSTTCASCHGDGVYAGKSTACVSCHQADYNGTTDPNHVGAGFPTQCQTCHSTSSFQGAVFSDHDPSFFPIYSGIHQGLWSGCTDCHVNSQNFGQFSCFNCHPHSDKTQTDSNHSGVSGYSYDSNACYSCHPRGRP